MTQKCTLGCIAVLYCFVLLYCIAGPDNLDSKVHVALYRGAFGSSHGKERGNGVTQSQFVNG